MKNFLLLVFLAACSSAPKESKTGAPELITNESFKKDRPLSSEEVSDFYKGNVKALNPALEDETLDRYSQDELSAISVEGDPLLEISLRCARGDYENAFQVAAQSFNRYQKIPAYWNQVANCHLNSGAHRKALLFYNKALEVSPEYTPALNNIGVMYIRQGQFQKALAAFERAVTTGKYAKTPRYNLAKLYLTYGLTDSALPIFEGLLRAAASDIDLLNSVASSHFLSADYHKALSYYQKIPAGEWGRPEIGLNLALTLKHVGKSQEAINVFRKIVRPSSQDLSGYYSIVQAQLGAN